MAPTVRVEHVAANGLAAVRKTSSRGSLGRDIVAGLDVVWPVLRAQSVSTGRNVVVYHGSVDDIEVGVEVDSPFHEAGEVRRSRTPEGDAAAVTHWGDYSAMQPAYTHAGHLGDLAPRSLTVVKRGIVDVFRTAGHSH